MDGDKEVSMSTRVDKAWGFEDVITNEPEYCCKRLVIAPGKKCSLHYHNEKKETFYVEHGWVLLETADIRGNRISETLMPGDSRTIPSRTLHRFSSKLGATILEISTHHEDSDVVRLEPSGEILLSDSLDGSSANQRRSF